ncbi:MAG: SurA N-terminal domain-containing protein [Woeseiaceae bacterium]
MLQDIREKFIGTTGKIILAVILLLLAGTGLNYTLTPNRFVAKVGGEEISLRAVNDEFRNQLARFGDQELPEAFLTQIRAGAVEQVINQTVLQQFLRDEGFAVSDEMIAKAIREVPDFQTDGKFDRDAYAQILSLNQLSPAGFEASQRQRMMMGQFQQNLAASAFVTPDEFRRLIELTGQKREVEFATISSESFKEDLVVTEEEIAAWYEANPLQYQTPASVELDYLLIDENTARNRIDTSDENLRGYYDSIRSQYEASEQRRASHILLDGDDDELAADVLARIRAGEAFETLVTEFSVDGASARNGGDLGWVTTGVFAGPVEDAVFAMEQGQISDVVESEFGLHIIRLDGVRAGDPPVFEEVRDDVTERYVADRLLGEMTDLRSKLDDQYFDNASMEQMAEALGIEVLRVADFTAQSILPFGREEPIVDALFGANAIGDQALSEPVTLDGNRTVVLRVAERQEAGRQALASVQDDIRERLIEEGAAAIAEERGAQLAGALRSEPTMDFETLVLNSGAELTEKKAIERSDASVPAALTAAVFAAPVPQLGSQHVGSVSAPGVGFLIYRMTNVVPGTVPDVPQAQIDAGRRQLALRNGGAQLDAILSELRSRADVEMGNALELNGGL